MKTIVVGGINSPMKVIVVGGPPVYLSFICPPVSPLSLCLSVSLSLSLSLDLVYLSTCLSHYLSRLSVLLSPVSCLSLSLFLCRPGIKHIKKESNTFIKY